MKRSFRRLRVESLEQRHLLASGDVDLTFGTQGNVSTEFTESQAWGRLAFASVVQADGKIVTAGEGTVARYLPDGTPDSSFGSGGIAPFPNYARGLALTSTGRIVVVGGSAVAGSTQFVVARYMPNGSLDTSFDGDGIASSSFTGIYTEARGVVVQANGRIVVVGVSGNSIAAVRYLANGTLDTTFDGDGKLERQISASDSANAVAVQANGRIVIAGTSLPTGSFRRSVLAMRLLPSGALDRSFDGDGFAMTNATSSSTEFGNGISIQADGKLVVSGHSRASFTDRLALFRYNSDGSLDPTFDGDGVKLVGVSTVGGSNYTGNGVVVQSDGKIVTQANSLVYRFNSDGSSDTTFNSFGFAGVLGSSRSLSVLANGSILVPGVYNQLYGIAKLNADGSRDLTFSRDGHEFGSPGSSVDVAAASILQADGKQLVVGNSNNRFGIARYNSNGTLDTTYGQGGKATVAFADAWDVKAKDVAVQADGKILIVGSSRYYTGTNLKDRFTLVRLNPNGSLDTTFAGDGIAEVDSEGSGGGNSVTVQANGRIVVAGAFRNYFSVLRFMPNGTLDRSFSGDGIAYIQAAMNSEALDVVVQPDGKLLAVGSYIQSSSARYASALMMARFNPNGAFDTAFGTNGRRVELGLEQRSGEQVELLSDGSFLVVGNAAIYNSNSLTSNMAISKFNGDGSLFGSFGVSGSQIVPFQRSIWDFGSDRVNALAKGLLVQADGKIVIGGTVLDKMGVARLTADGILDTSFSSDGKATFDFGTGLSSAVDILQQESGRLVVVGSQASDDFYRPDSDFVLLGLQQVAVPAASTLVRLTSNSQVEILDQWSRNDAWEIVAGTNLGDIIVRDISGDPRSRFEIAGIPQVTLVNDKEIFIPGNLVNKAKPLLLRGLAGDDLFKIDSNRQGVFVTGIGGDGMDTFDASAISDNVFWNMDSNGSGKFFSFDIFGGYRFATVESFRGGTGNDRFEVHPSASTTMLRFDGGDGTGIDELQSIADANMAFSSEFLPFDEYRLDVSGAITQRLAIRKVESLFLWGGDSDNTLDARRFQGRSMIIGGIGNDILHGSAGGSQVFGGVGDDQLYGGNGNDQLAGSDGNDLLVGGAGDDRLLGEFGNDILVGEGGADVLIGGFGEDILIGGYTIALAQNSSVANRNAVLALWNAPTSYEERTASLLSAPADTSLAPANTVFNDSSVDIFEGKAGRDWFFASNSTFSLEVDIEGQVGDSAADELKTLIE